VKDKYFGDQTDYIKHGILRSICNSGIPLGIHWTWTPDDSTTDGSRTAYLRAAHHWRRFDPRLFDAISDSLRAGRRTLKVLLEQDLLPGAVLCFDEWGRDFHARRRSLEGFTSQLAPNSFVFLDPDNGLEVASIPPGAPASTKYVYFDEVRQVWGKGHSLMIYQHFPRVNRRKYVLERLNQLTADLPYSRALAILTSHVAFLGVLQENGAVPLWQVLVRTVARWAPHVQLLHRTDGGTLVDVPLPSLSQSPQAELQL